jgi:hypothetical protein
VKKLFIAIALCALALPAVGATDLFTANGITVAASSTCPAGSAGFCSGGWFRLSGAMIAAVQVTASAGTNTVLLEHRMDPNGPTSTLYTWTNASTTTVGRAIVPPIGEVRVRATALSGGTLKGKLTASKADGTVLW